MRGGAGVAWSDEVDALTANPALMMKGQGGSSFGGDYLNLPNNRDGWSVGIVDGRSPLLGGFRFDWANEGRVKRYTMTGGAAYSTSFGTFGVSAHAHKFNRLLKDNGWHFTQTAGVFVPIGSGFSIGIIGKNLLDKTKDSVLPPEFACGFVYQYEQAIIFQFQADRRFEIPNQDFSYSTGVDILTQKFFAVRGGFRWDHEKTERFWSAGMALESPRSSLGGFYTRTIESPHRNGYGFKLALKF